MLFRSRDTERLDDVLFLDLERPALDHHDRGLGAGDDDVHVAELERLERRIEHPLPLDAPDADASAADCTKDYTLSITDGQTVNEPFRFGGVGQGKLDRYGEAVLKVVREN